jgi:transcriptional regulatory protein RtcR
MASKIKKTVVIGLLGTTLDAAHGSKADRWSAWRPTIALGQNEDLLLHRFELLYPPKWLQLAQTIVEDLRSVSPETEVRLHAAQIDDPWDFAQVYGSLFDFARAYPFDTENEDYLIHITTGTHVAQICLFLLTEAHWLPGRLLQGEPPRRGEDGEGRYRIIDLDLSRYDAIASRFKQTEKEGVVAG